MKFDVGSIDQQPFIEQNSIISPLENELTSMQLITIVCSVLIGCLLGQLDGIVLILSPLYINKSSYVLAIVLLGLIITGEFKVQDILRKSMIGLNLGNVMGNLLKKRQQTRYLRVTQKIINVNFPIFV